MGDRPAARCRRRADVEFRAAGGVAQQHVDRRPHYPSPRAARCVETILHVGIVSRSASRIRLPRAVVEAVRPRERHAAEEPQTRSRAPTMVAQGDARRRAATLRSGDAQIPRRRLTRARPDRRAARAHDRELLRHDFADRPQRRPHTRSAGCAGARGQHARYLHHRSRRPARQPRPVSERPDTVRGFAAYRHDSARARRRRQPGRDGAGVHTRSRGDVLRLRRRDRADGGAEPHAETAADGNRRDARCGMDGVARASVTLRRRPAVAHRAHQDA